MVPPVLLILAEQHLRKYAYGWSGQGAIAGEQRISHSPHHPHCGFRTRQARSTFHARNLSYWLVMPWYSRKRSGYTLLVARYDKDQSKFQGNSKRTRADFRARTLSENLELLPSWRRHWINCRTARARVSKEPLTPVTKAQHRLRCLAQNEQLNRCTAV